MATIITERHLANGYVEGKNILRALKNTLTSRRDNMAAGTVPASVVLAIFQTVKDELDNLNAIIDIPGLLQYAKDQETDQAYDAPTEFTASAAALDAMLDQILLDIPRLGEFLLIQKLDKVDGLTWRDFTTVQTETLRGDIDTFLATLAPPA